MPDFADDGAKASEHELSVALANHAQKQRGGLRPYTGFCHYCSAALPDPERFCDDDCKEDQLYEEERRAHLRL